MGKQWKQWQTLFFLGSKITTDGDCSHEIKRRLLLRRKAMTNIEKQVEKQRHYFANKGPSSQGYGFSSSHVWIWELDYNESWAPKNWCFWTMVLEKTLDSHLDCKEIKPLNSKGNRYWIFTGRTDAEAETPILWPPDALAKTLTLETIESKRRGWHRGWGSWMASPTQWTWVWASSRSWWWTRKPGVLHAVHVVAKSQTWLSDWTELNCLEWLRMRKFCFAFQTQKFVAHLYLIIFPLACLSPPSRRIQIAPSILSRNPLREITQLMRYTYFPC